MAYAEGGTVRGKGQIIRKDGTVVDFELTSDPLTKEQAEQLNQQEDKPHGSNTPNNR